MGSPTPAQRQGTTLLSGDAALFGSQETRVFVHILRPAKQPSRKGKSEAEGKAAKDTHAPVVWRWGGCEGRTMWVAAMFLSSCSWDEKSTSALYFPWRELSMNHLGLIFPQKQNWIQKPLRETMSITASSKRDKLRSHEGVSFSITFKSMCASEFLCTKVHSLLKCINRNVKNFEH